jgi:hypothetical protein
VSFQQACQVFKDPMALTLFDEEHSLDEERFLLCFSPMIALHFNEARSRFSHSHDRRLLISIMRSLSACSSLIVFTLSVDRTYASAEPREIMVDEDDELEAT